MGQRWRLTSSRLLVEMTLSAMALSRAVPVRPRLGAMPAATRRSVFDALEPPLRTVCGFIPYSRLFAEAEVVRRYGDQLKPGFLSGIAEYAPDVEEGCRSA